LLVVIRFEKNIAAFAKNSNGFFSAAAACGEKAMDEWDH